MSKVAIQGNASGSGVLTIAAPNTNSDRTLTLPDNSGTLLSNASTAGFPAGSVLQVVQGTYATEVTSSSTTFTDTGLSATITPTSATSKILVLVTQAGCGKNTGNTLLRLRLLRGETSIIDFERNAGFDATTGSNFVGSSCANYLDSPATTAATTYKTQLSCNGTATVFVQAGSSGVNATSTITLMEIAA